MLVPTSRLYVRAALEDDPQGLRGVAEDELPFIRVPLAVAGRGALASLRADPRAARYGLLKMLRGSGQTERPLPEKLNVAHLRAALRVAGLAAPAGAAREALVSILREATTAACVDAMNRRDVSPRAMACAMCMDVRTDVLARGLSGGQFSVERVCDPCFSGSTARAMELAGIEAGSFECLTYVQHEIEVVRQRREGAHDRPPPLPPPPGVNEGARPSPATMMAGAGGPTRRLIWDARRPTPTMPAYGQSLRRPMRERPPGLEQHFNRPMPTPQRQLLQATPQGADRFGSPAAAMGGGAQAAQGRGGQPAYTFSPAGFPVQPSFTSGQTGAGQENRNGVFDVLGARPKSASIKMCEFKERHALIAAAEAARRGEFSSLDEWRTRVDGMDSPPTAPPTARRPWRARGSAGSRALYHRDPSRVPSSASPWAPPSSSSSWAAPPSASSYE